MVDLAHGFSAMKKLYYFIITILLEIESLFTTHQCARCDKKFYFFPKFNYKLFKRHINKHFNGVKPNKRLDKRMSRRHKRTENRLKAGFSTAREYVILGRNRPDFFDKYVYKNYLDIESELSMIGNDVLYHALIDLSNITDKKIARFLVAMYRNVKRIQHWCVVHKLISFNYKYKFYNDRI